MRLMAWEPSWCVQYEETTRIHIPGLESRPSRRPENVSAQAVGNEAENGHRPFDRCDRRYSGP